MKVITIQFLDTGAIVETVALGSEIPQASGPPAHHLEKRQYGCCSVEHAKEIVDDIMNEIIQAQEGPAEGDTVH